VRVALPGGSGDRRLLGRNSVKATAPRPPIGRRGSRVGLPGAQAPGNSAEAWEGVAHSTGSLSSAAENPRLSGSHAPEMKGVEGTAGSPSMAVKTRRWRQEGGPAPLRAGARSTTGALRAWAAQGRAVAAASWTASVRKVAPSPRGDGLMVKSEAPTKGESRRQQLLPPPPITAPVLESTEAPLLRATAASGCPASVDRLSPASRGSAPCRNAPGPRHHSTAEAGTA
jgi:hypothetical protein